MKKIAVFPGSFDPPTIGHQSVVNRSIELFDEIIIAVGINSQKKYQWSLEQRIDWLEKVFASKKNVKIDSYQGLTIDYCKKVKANYILRGLRTSADFEFERGIAQMNKTMMPEVETIFILSTPEHTAINSTIIRDIVRNGGDASNFVPKEIKL